MLPFVETILYDLVASFLDPKKRMFLGYLLSALLIALGYLLFVRRLSITVALQQLFSRRVWGSASAKADYRITGVNLLLMKLISPALVTQLALATALFVWLYEWLPSRPLVLTECSDVFVGFLFTAIYFLLDDFARFYVHRLLHRWPALWAFHKVHHSAQRLTPFTVFRTHPVESIIFTLRSALTQGIAIGAFVFFLGDRADLVTVLGANIFVFFFNMIGANLRHSHVPIRYWEPLEKLFLSPAQHQIHHSIEPRHWDKNFGVALSIWDRLFGSFHASESRSPKAFGVAGQPPHTLRALYWEPCRESARSLKRTSIMRLSPRTQQTESYFMLPQGKTVYDQSNKPH